MHLIVAATLMLSSSTRPVQPVVIRIYDAYGVTPAETEKAEATAAAILETAGIHLRWCPPPASPARQSEVTPCDATPELPDLILRIVTAGHRDAAGSLGYSYVDVHRRAGLLATVFADRVQGLARQVDSDVGKLLGRAMAHEIGHLLLGTSKHSSFGLMRSHWQALELRHDLRWDWMFTGREAAEMRRRLVTRSRPEAPCDCKASSEAVERRGS
jgi:hypothetical protein